MKKNIVFAVVLTALIFTSTPVFAQTTDSVFDQILKSLQSLSAQFEKLTNRVSQLETRVNTLSQGPLSSPLILGIEPIENSIRFGSRGDEVVNLQKILIARGYLTGDATGYFGSLTEAGLKRFQADNALDQSGSTDSATRDVIKRVFFAVLPPAHNSDITPSSTITLTTTTIATTTPIRVSPTSCTATQYWKTYTGTCLSRSNCSNVDHGEYFTTECAEVRSGTIPSWAVATSSVATSTTSSSSSGSTGSTGSTTSTTTSTTSTASSTSTTNGSIAVTSPSGGASLAAGSTYTVSWTASNVSSAFDVYLYYDGSMLSYLGNAAAGATSFSWTISTSRTYAGSGYTIRVSSSLTSDDSDAFTINSAATAPDSASLIGHWKFDGNGSNEVSGKPAATTVGNAVFNASGGKYGGYLYISASGDYAKIPYSSTYDLSDSFTVEFWFRQRSNQSSLQDLVYKGSGSNNYNFRVFRQLWNEYNFGPIIAGYTAASTGYWNQSSNSNEMAHNTWHHVVFFKSATSRGYYLDGTLINANTSDSPTAKTPATDIFIGNPAIDTDIDNLKIFNRALTGGEIQYEMTTAVAPVASSQLADMVSALSQLVQQLTSLFR